MKRLFFLQLVLLTALSADIPALAQIGSTDPNNPKPLGSNTITGKLTQKKAVYYYSFTGGPGKIDLTAQGTASNYSCIVEAALVDANGKEIGLVQITPDSGGQTKTISKNVSSKQKMTLRVELDRVASDYFNYQITLGGAVSLAQASEIGSDAPVVPQTKKPIKIPGRINTGGGNMPKIKIPGSSKILGEKPPQESQNPTLENLFTLTPQASFNKTGFLEFISPSKFSAKENYARFAPTKGAAVVALTFNNPGAGTYYFDVSATKVSEYSGNGGGLVVRNQFTGESLGSYNAAFSGNGKQTLSFTAELPAGTNTITIEAPKMDWIFHSIQVKRLKQ